ncbi:MAG TPA: hypothetical protein VK152_11645 [Paludibacter sp.]|nr:hypothetical protein [Paludibacter sp.]
MGLVILKLTERGVQFENAYAKVDNVSYDNNSKIASFDVAIYDSKDNLNLIKKITGLFVKVVSGTDTTAQCYNRIAELTASIKADAESKQQLIDAETDINRKFMLERQLSMATKPEIMALDAALMD